MNRSELAHAFNSVLPHVGKRAPHDAVHVDYRAGNMYLCATDTYTLGIARVPSGANLSLALPTSEATELMRFVRPTKKATEIEEVAVGVKPGEPCDSHRVTGSTIPSCEECRNGELHIGLVDSDDSAVFETVDLPSPLEQLLGYCEWTYGQPVEYREQVFDPRLFERFAKAKQLDTDRLRMYPRRSIERNGVAVVTVGEHFIGAVAGLDRREPGDSTVQSFLHFAGEVAA